MKDIPVLALAGTLRFSKFIPNEFVMGGPLGAAAHNRQDLPG